MRSLSEALLFVVVVASRLPFVSVDFGAEPDAFRVVLAGDGMRASLAYQASRYGANPFHEIATALIPTHEPAILNSIGAVLIAIAAVAFARIWRQLELPAPWLAGAALAFFPIVYIASTSYKDYAWTLAFAVFALRFAMRGRAIACGVWLALAIGCRLTMVVVVPAYLAILVVGLADHRGLARPVLASYRREIAAFVVAVGLVTLVLFLPPLIRYGAQIVQALPSIERTSHEHLRRWTVMTGGILGTLVMMAMMAVAFVRVSVRRTRALSWFAPGLALACAAQVGLYVYNPGSSIGSYSPYVVPFVLLLVGPALTRREWVVAGVLLLLSPFVLSDAPLSNPNNRMGPVLADHARRVIARESRARLLAQLATVEPEAIVAVGSLHPALLLERAEGVTRPELIYAFQPGHLSSGRPRYYVDGQKRWVESEGVTVEGAGVIAMPRVER